MVYLPKDNI